MQNTNKFTLASCAFGSLLLSSAFAADVASNVTFLGVASGDVSDHDATVWTRAVDPAAPQATLLRLQVTTDPLFNLVTLSEITDLTVPENDYTLKIDFSGLAAATQYYYRFIGPSGETSIVGKFKTAPAPTASANVRFAFSGDNDGLMRPYALASTVPAQNFDFYMNLGDVIYENASNVTGSANSSVRTSPSVTLSNDALNFNGVPRAFNPTVGAAPFATQAQLKADYYKKYRENFLAVNNGGQNGLQSFYAAQGMYTTWDNHELGNRKYIDGGAPAGGSVGGPLGTDMPTGRGVDARNNGSGNLGNVNDVNNSLTDYMNRSVGFQALSQTFFNTQPIANRGLVNNASDPRSHGTRIYYFAQQWGKNVLFMNLDCRSYRDIRLKTATANADDSSAPRANNPGRTLLGSTQLAWMKQTLLAAQAAGTTWKFVTTSDPMDQIGPIGGALTLTNLPSFGTGSTYSAVNADAGKSWMGNYRAERNALLKFIADNKITNVVFLTADDHQNRINELTYSPTGATEVQASYVKVPYCFEIVAGPLGATGPDLITNHTFAMAQQLSNSLYNAQVAAGVEPFGLQGYPGLGNVYRENDSTAAANPTTVDFYSPDTFNYNILSTSPDGKKLTVTGYGMDATAQNAGLEYSSGPQARTIFSFDIDSIPVTRSGFVSDRRLNKIVQQVTVTNNTGSALIGPVNLVLHGLSGNTALSNATGGTAGDPSITVTSGNLAPGTSATVSLQFNRPTTGGITYTTEVQ